MGDNNNQNIINEVTSLIRRWEEERTPPTYDPVPTLTKYVFETGYEIVFAYPNGYQITKQITNNLNEISYHYVFLPKTFL